MTSMQLREQFDFWHCQLVGLTNVIGNYRFVVRDFLLSLKGTNCKRKGLGFTDNQAAFIHFSSDGPQVYSVHITHLSLEFFFVQVVSVGLHISRSPFHAPHSGHKGWCRSAPLQFFLTAT